MAEALAVILWWILIGCAVAGWLFAYVACYYANYFSDECKRLMAERDEARES